MQLDIRTIILSYVISNALCLGVMALVWQRNRQRFAGLGLWLADFILQFAALGLVTLRGALPDFVTVVVSNTLVIGGTVLLYEGLGRFATGQRVAQVHNAILLAAFAMVHTYFALAQPNLAARNINLSIGLLVICAQCAWLMLRQVDATTRPTTRLVGWVLAGYGLVSLARIVTTIIAPPGNDALRESGLFDALALVTYQMLFIALTFGLITMVNHRLFLEFQTQAEMRRASEQLYHQMFSEHSAVKLLVDPETGAIVQANPAAAQFYGYPVETLQAMTIYQINTLPREHIQAAMQNAHQRARNYFTFQHRLASGAVRDVEVHSTPIQIAGRALLYSIIHDITERKRAEETIRQQGEFLKTALDALAHPFYIINASDYTIQMANAAFGPYTAGDTTCYARTHQVLSPCNSTAHPCPLDEIRQTRQPAVVEHVHYDAAGHPRHIQSRAYPIFDKQGNLSQIIEYTLDITERKQAEEALRESEATLRTLIDANPDAVCLTDTQGIILAANETTARRLNLSQAQLPGVCVYDLLPPEVAPSRRAKVDQAARTGHPVRFEDVRAGRCIDNYIHPILAEDGSVRQIAIVGRDITDRKQAEESLQVALTKYKTLFASFPLVITISDHTGQIVETNLHAEKLLGVPQAEHTQRTLDGPQWQIIRPDGTPMPPEEYASVRALAEKTLVENVEMGIVKPQGEITWISVTAAPLPLAGYGVVVTYGDITARKQAEEALRESETRLRAISDNLPMGQIYQLMVRPDGTSRFTYVSSAVERLHECTPEEALADPSRLFSRVVEDDREGMRLAIEKSIRAMSVYNHTVRIRRKSGEIRWHQQISKPRLAEGNVILFDGIDMDVTERKQAEAQINQLAKFPAENPNPVLRITPKGELLYSNAASAPLLKLWSCQADRALPAEWRELAQAAIASGVAQQTEIQADQRVFAFTFAPVAESGYVNVYGLDITDRKQAAEQIRQDAHTKAQLLREINHRVGNNLTLLLILVGNDLERAQGAEAQALLLDLQGCVKSMVDVHRLLNAAQWGPVELDQLARQVVRGVLAGTPGRDRVRVVVDAPAAPVRVGPKQAFKVALILNELTTNCVKYAFRDGAAGRITIVVKATGEAQAQLEFCDDGPGWPPDVLNGQRQDIGLELIRMWVEQEMRGRVTLRNNAGAVIECAFDINLES